MFDAETLLFVKHEKSQVFKCHIFLKQPVSSNDNIYVSWFKITDNLTLLAHRPKSVQTCNINRVAFKTVGERWKMLFCKHRGRHKYGNLFTVTDGHKRWAQSNFCLTISHITTYQSVHGNGWFHIIENIFNSVKLVWCLLVRETGFKIEKISIYFPESVAMFNLTLGVKFQEFSGDSLRRFFYPGFDPIPWFAAHFIKNRLDTIHPYVFLNHAHAIYRQVEFVIIFIDNQKKIIVRPVQSQFYQTVILPYSVFNVNNKVPLF